MEIVVAALIAALLLIVEHYFPWQLALGRRLPRLAAYVIGVLAFLAPVSILFLIWTREPPGYAFAHLAALWIVTGGGGAAVIGCYALDWLLNRLALAKELGEILERRDGRTDPE